MLNEVNTLLYVVILYYTPTAVVSHYGYSEMLYHNTSCLTLLIQGDAWRSVAVLQQPDVLSEQQSSW